MRLALAEPQTFLFENVWIGGLLGIFGVGHAH